MVDENEVKGAAREFGGRVQDAIGGLAGDAKTQAEGKWNQAAGRAQRSFGSAIDDVIGGVQDKPIAALAAVAGVAFLAGWLMRK